MFQISLQLVRSFSLLLSTLGENRAKLGKLFNLNNTKHNAPDTQNTLINFLSAIALMQMIFLTKDNFRFISD